MRHLRRITNVAAIAMIVPLIAGCQKNSVLDNRLGFNELGTDAFAVVDYFDVDASIQDATLDGPMTMEPVFKAGRFHRRGGYKGGRGGHLGHILRELGITEEQRTAVKELLACHREGIKSTFETLREVNQGVIDAARADRDQIIDAVRHGELTREEAREQLQTLSQGKREAIANNPDSAPHLAAICATKLALFDAVRALLDETQQTSWDEWVAGLDGLCFSADGGN